MPVQASCDHCGFTYVAKDDMAGKKVRCRNCGQVFTVAVTNPAHAAPGTQGATDAAFDQSAPPPDLSSLEDLPNVPSAASPYVRSSDITRVMPAIQTSESNMTGGIGSAKSMMQRTGDPGTVEMSADGAVPTGRQFTPFDFPFARELDRFAPKVAIGLMLLWVAYVAFAWNPANPAAIPDAYPPSQNPTYPDWAGLIPAAVMLGLFVILWLPVHALALRQLSTTLKSPVPTDNKTRAAALAVFPFALGAVLWLTGWSIGSLVSGVVLGIVIGTPSAWFLYRLKEKEIPYAAAFLVGASLAASLLSCALYMGANEAVNRILVASGKGALFDVSPMGPHLSWTAPPGAQAKTTAAQAGNTGKAPANVGRGPANPGGTAAAADVVPPQSFLLERKEYRFERDPQRVLMPPGRDDMVGIVSQAKNSPDLEIVRYKLDDKAASPLDKVAAPVPGEGCLSQDADRMAMLVRSMGNIPVVKVWSFTSDKLDASWSPPEWQASDTIQLLGFTDASHVVCVRRQRGGMQPLTLDLQVGVAQPWIVPPAPAGGLAPAGGRMFEDRFRELYSQMIAWSADFRNIAVIAYSPEAGKSFLRIYRSDGLVVDCDLRIPDRTMALNPTGISFSPDGTQVAASFERPGAMSILTCPVMGRDTATPAFDGGASCVLGIKLPDSRDREMLMPRGPAARERDNSPDATPPAPPQNQLVWLDGGDRWLYGTMILDGPTQQKQGTIDLGQRVVQMTIAYGRELMALVGTDRGNVMVRATIATSPAPAGAGKPATTNPQ